MKLKNSYKNMLAIKSWKKKERREVKKSKVCVFTLTYQRPEYIRRSLESLYKRAGCKFDLYVFDDASDAKTQKELKKLKSKYHFNLFFNKTHLNIYKSFYKNIGKIPLTYDYYVKFDSDIEILTDDFFPLAFEVFKMNGVTGLTPRVEGIMNSDRYDAVIEFFCGHTIKLKAPIVYGCCLILSSVVFNTLKRLTQKELIDSNEKWGVDSKLYEHSLDLGRFLIVEDLSVYHIDNTYGQRRKYADYYMDRSRWKNVDLRDIWFIKASKVFAPKFIKKEDLLRIQRESTNFEVFVKNCKDFINEHKAEVNPDNIDEEDFEFIKSLESQKLPPEPGIIIKKFYRICSPLNFRPDPNIGHGTYKMYKEVPKWAKNNPRVVVEEIDPSSINKTEGYVE